MKKANQAKKIVPAAVAAGLVMTSGLTAFAADAAETNAPDAESAEPSASQQSEEDDTSGDKTDEETAVEETKIEQAVPVGEAKTDTETGKTTEEKLVNVDVDEETTEFTKEGTAEVSTTVPTKTDETAVTPVEGAEEKIPEAGTTIEKDAEGNEVITEITNKEGEKKENPSETDSGKPAEGTVTETNPITAPSGKEIGQETTETTTTITGEKTETDTTSTTITTPEDPIKKTEGGDATDKVEETLTDESGKKVDPNYNTDADGKATSDRDWSTVTSGDKFTVSGTDYTVDSNEDVKDKDDNTVGHKITLYREDTYEADMTGDELCEVLGADKSSWKASETDADTYTYTNADGKTVTVKVTRDDSSVTVKSTIVITETDDKEDKTAEKDNISDTKVEVNESSDQTIKDAMDLVTYNKATGEYEAKDSKTTVVSLKDVGDEFEGSISTIVKTKDNGATLTYTFEYTKSEGEPEKASEAAIAALGSDGIAQLLNDTHYTSLDGKLYYTDDNGIQRELDLTETQDALKQKGVSVKVTLKDSEKYDSADKYLDNDQKPTSTEQSAVDSAEDAAHDKAKKDALLTAATGMKVKVTDAEGNVTYRDATAADVSKDYTLTVYTEYTTSDGQKVYKEHVLTATLDADGKTGDTKLNTGDIKIDVSDGAGKQYNSEAEFSSGIKYTVNGNAHVSSEVITWTVGQKVTVSEDEEAGSVTITVNESGTASVTGAGDDDIKQTDSGVDKDGNSYTVYTKTVTDEANNKVTYYTYTITQSTLDPNSDEYKAELAKHADDTDFDSTSNPNLTKVTWSVTTTTVETKTGISTDEASKLKKGDEDPTTTTIDTDKTIVRQSGKADVTGDYLDTFNWGSVASGDKIAFVGEDGKETEYTVIEGGNVTGENEQGYTTHTITMTSEKKSTQLLTASDVETLYGLDKDTLTQATDKDGNVIKDTYTYTENGNEITIKVTHNIGTDVATSTLKLTVTDNAKSETAWNVPIKDTTVDLDAAKTENTLIAEAMSKTSKNEDGTYTGITDSDGVKWTVAPYTEGDWKGSIQTITGTGSDGKAIVYTFKYEKIAGSETHNITGEMIEALGNQAIADMLNRAEGSHGGYYVSKDGETLYDKYGHAITSVTGIQEELAKQNVKVTVTKSDGNNYKDSTEKTISDEETETKAAKKQAADNALAAAMKGIDGATQVDGTYNYNEDTGVLTVDVTDKDGKTHALVINVAANKPTSEDTTELWSDVKIDGTFHSGTKYTVTADANVSKETITWTETGKEKTATEQTITGGAKLSVGSNGTITLKDASGNALKGTTADGKTTYTYTDSKGIQYTYVFNTTPETVSSTSTEYQSILENLKTNLKANNGNDAESIVDNSLKLYKLTYSVTTVSSDGTTELKGHDFTTAEGEQGVEHKTVDTSNITVTQKRTGSDGSTSVTETSDVGLDTFDWTSVKKGDTITLKVGDGESAKNVVYTVDEDVTGTSANTSYTIKLTATDTNTQELTKANIAAILGNGLTEKDLTEVTEGGKTYYTYTEAGTGDTIKVDISSLIASDKATSKIELTVNKNTTGGSGDAYIKDTVVDLSTIKADDGTTGTVVSEALTHVTQSSTDHSFSGTDGWSVDTYDDEDNYQEGKYNGSIKTISSTDGKIVYTFTYSEGNEGAGQSATDYLKNVDLDTVAAMLNAYTDQSGYWASEDGKLYDVYGHELTITDAASVLKLQNVTVNVRKKDTNYYTTGTTVILNSKGETVADADTAEAAAKAAAKQAAAEAVLNSAKNSINSSSTKSIKYNANTDTWTLVVDDATDTSKTYTLTVKGSDIAVTEDDNHNWTGTIAGTSVNVSGEGVENLSKTTWNATSKISSEVVRWTATESKEYASAANTVGGQIKVDKDGNVTFGTQTISPTTTGGSTYTWDYTAAGSSTTYHYTLTIDKTAKQSDNSSTLLDGKTYNTGLADTDGTIMSVVWSVYTTTVETPVNVGSSDVSSKNTDTTNVAVDNFNKGTTDWAHLTSGTKVTYDNVVYTVKSKTPGTTTVNGKTENTHTITLESSDITVSGDTTLTQAEVISKLGLTEAQKGTIANSTSGTFTYRADGTATGDLVTVTYSTSASGETVKYTLTVTATDQTVEDSGTVSDTTVELPSSSSVSDNIVKAALDAASSAEENDKTYWESGAYAGSLKSVTVDGVTYEFSYSAGTANSSTTDPDLTKAKAFELLGGTSNNQGYTYDAATDTLKKGNDVLTLVDAQNALNKDKVTITVTKKDSTGSSEGTWEAYTATGYLTEAQAKSAAEAAAQKDALLAAAKKEIDTSATISDKDSNGKYTVTVGSGATAKTYTVAQSNGKWVMTNTADAQETYSFTLSEIAAAADASTTEDPNPTIWESTDSRLTDDYAAGRTTDVSATAGATGVVITGSSTENVTVASNMVYIGSDGTVTAPESTSTQTVTTHTTDGKIDRITITENGQTTVYTYTYTTYTAAQIASMTAEQRKELLGTTTGDPSNLPDGATVTSYSSGSLTTIKWEKTVTSATVTDGTTSSQTNVADAVTKANKDATDNATAVSNFKSAIESDLETLAKYATTGLNYSVTDGDTTKTADTTTLAKDVARMNEIKSQLDALNLGTAPSIDSDSDGIADANASTNISNYTANITKYNSLKSEYEALHSFYAAAIQANNSGIYDSSSTLYQYAIKINDCNKDNVICDEQTWSQYGTDKYRLLDSVSNRLKAAGYTGQGTTYSGTASTNWTTDKASKEYDELATAVSNAQSALSAAKAALPTDTSATDYAEKLKAYQDAGAAYNSAVNAYNKFVSAVNYKTTSSSGNVSTDYDSSEWGYALNGQDSVTSDTVVQQVKYTTSNGTKDYQFFIQIGGTIQFEGDEKIHYSNGYYAQADRNTSRNQTQITNGYVKNYSSSGNNGYIYVTDAQKLLTDNGYNQQKLNVDPLTKYKDADGNEVDISGLSTSEKITAIFSGVQNVVSTDPSGSKSNEEIQTLLNYLQNTGNRLQTSDQYGGNLSTTTKYTWDSTGYSEYSILNDLASQGQLGVVWYVVGKADTHVDGLIYFKNTGTIYSNTELQAITTLWSDDSDALATLPDMDVVNRVTAITTPSKDNGTITDGTKVYGSYTYNYTDSSNATYSSVTQNSLKKTGRSSYSERQKATTGTATDAGTLYSGSVTYTYQNYNNTVTAKKDSDYTRTLTGTINRTTRRDNVGSGSGLAGKYDVNYEKNEGNSATETSSDTYYTYGTKTQSQNGLTGTGNGTVYEGHVGYNYTTPSYTTSETTTHELTSTATITKTRTHVYKDKKSDPFGTYAVYYKHVNKDTDNTTEGQKLKNTWKDSGTGNWYTYYTQSASENNKSGTSNLGSIYTGKLDYSYNIPTFSATEQTTHKREFDADTEIVKTTVHETENAGSGIRGTYDVNYKHTNTDTGTDENGDKINDKWTGKGTGDWYKYKTKRQNDDVEGSTTGYVYVGGVKYTYQVPDNKLEAKWEKVYTRNLDADVTSSIDYKVWEYTETTKKVTTLYPSDDEHDNGGDIVPVVPVIVPTTPVVPGETTPVEPGIVPIGTEVTTPAAPAETTPAASKLPQTGASWLEAMCMAMLGFALSLGSIFSKGKHEKE